MFPQDLHSAADGPKHVKHAGWQFAQELFKGDTYWFEEHPPPDGSHVGGVYIELAHATQPLASQVIHFELHFKQTPLET